MEMQSDLWQRGELLAVAARLKLRAAAEGGAASERLGVFARHYTEVAYRVASGIGELHHRWADTFFVVEGTAEVLTGGELVAAREVGAGEERGTSITGTAFTDLTRQKLAVGDVIHIPAGMPHQMILAEGETICYFVMKTEERE